MKKVFLGFYELDNIEDFKDDNSILLFGIPYERSIETPGGSKKAPNAIRKQSLEFSGVSMTFDITKSSKNFYDYGNIHPIKEKEKINAIWKKTDELDAKILVIGGDHSITFDTLSKAPWNEKIGLIWLDAHADLADEYPPGIFQSHGTVFSNLIEENNLKPEQMMLIGGHAYTQTSTEHDKIQNKEVSYLSMQQIFENKKTSMKFIEDFVDSYERIYLSIDLDVLDQAYVPTLGTAEPFGLSPTILQEFLKAILPKAKYVDIVESRHTYSNKIVPNFVVGLIFYILEIWDKN